MSLVLHDCSKSLWQNRYCNHLLSSSYLLRWRDCLKKYLRKAVGNEKWRENAYNREHGKKITKVAVQRNDE